MPKRYKKLPTPPKSGPRHETQKAVVQAPTHRRLITSKNLDLPSLHSSLSSFFVLLFAGEVAMVTARRPAGRAVEVDEAPREKQMAFCSSELYVPLTGK